MKSRVFIHNPEDVQSAIVALLTVFEKNPHPIALYPAAIERACRVLKVRGKYSPDKHSSTWSLASEWRKRLELAGLNPANPMQVIDQQKWDLAWQQLLETRTFRDDRQLQALAAGKIAPKAGPEVQAVALMPPTPKTTFSDYISANLKQKLARR